jgi:hypothetical protein
MQNLLTLTFVALCGILFVVACATPWILAVALHTIN